MSWRHHIPVIAASEFLGQNMDKLAISLPWHAYKNNAAIKFILTMISPKSLLLYALDYYDMYYLPPCYPLAFLFCSRLCEYSVNQWAKTLQK